LNVAQVCSNRFVEGAVSWRDRLFDGLEDVRSGELVHRDGQSLTGSAEKALEFAPTRLGADADGQHHLLLDER
jgi:hypothetical protein